MDNLVKSSLYWKRKTVFITGCSGFLGSWLTKALLGRGSNVVGLIRDFTPHSLLYSTGIDKKITQVQGDLTDYPLLERILNEYEIDTIFHLAAQPIVETANWSPLSTFESNIKGTWNLLEAARQARMLKRIIIASSDKAYGEQNKLPYKETTSLEGKHPYDVSKSCADLLSLSYYYTYRLPLSILRCANFYGGGDFNFNRIIPDTIQTVYFGKPPVIRSDGRPIRDYLYIEDAVAAFLLVAERMEMDVVVGQAFNFSYEVKYSVLQVVEMILALMRARRLKPIIEDRAKNEISRQYLSCEKSRKQLGWRPKFTFQEGLEKTIQWYIRYFKARDKNS